MPKQPPSDPEEQRPRPDLVMDTSTRYGGVALSAGGRLLRAVAWHSRGNHTAELMPAVEDVLARSETRLEALRGLGVALGPGGFGALRAGMSVAKGLAFALGIPLVGVSTLEAEAYPHWTARLPVCPILELGRGHIAWGRYQRSRSGWHALEPERVGTLEGLLESTGGTTLFCGEGAASCAGALKAAFGRRAVVIAACTPFTRLGGLAALAAARLDRGEGDGLTSLQPRYLRPPGITQPKPPSPVKRGTVPKRPLSPRAEKR